jgi:hypothetical protein
MLAQNAISRSKGNINDAEPELATFVFGIDFSTIKVLLPTNPPPRLTPSSMTS